MGGLIMNRYIIHCTEEQTKKALSLGAPIEILSNYTEFRGFPFIKCQDGNERPYVPPTTEQIIGWLEEQGILIDIDTEWNKSVLVYVWDCEIKSLINNVFHSSRQEATLDAIDAALEYLENNKK